MKELTFSVNISTSKYKKILEKYSLVAILITLVVVSTFSFITYHNNGLALAYNDARSHLNIGRRVVEGLKPGIAQLGSVWLPLPHIMMIPTVWNNFMWHSGLSGAIISMISFVAIGVLVYKFLEKLGVGLFGRIVGVFIFVANINILYLQTTAMTELLLIATMTAGAYELMLWHKNDSILHLIKSAFWIMLSTLTRYDGWFLLAWAGLLVILHTFKGKKYLQKTEGVFIFFSTLAGLGIVLWLLWNLVIFKDPLYFAFGPFSAKAQQDQLDQAGELVTKYNLWLSLKFYFYSLVYNMGAFHMILGFFGAAMLWMDKKIPREVRISMSTLAAPLFFNVIALFLGHSVLFIQGLSGDTWFNVRYGVMLAPSIAIFIGYLVHRSKNLRVTIVALLLFVTFFTFTSADAVTIDDARVGSSQKNVSEVSQWLAQNAGDKKGFILISAASHDAIIFSSGLPMKRFIHEGTGLYWESATTLPDRWARWIIMRTHDNNDLTFRLVKDTKGLEKYTLVESFPFADIYEIQPEYVGGLNLEPTLGRQK